MSAAREQPLTPEPARPLADRVKGGASETAFTSVALVKRWVADFRARDRFYQYKAGILAAWVALSAVCLVIACPSGGLERSARLGARLVLAGEAGYPVYTLFNDSKEPWTDVTVVVNQRYRAAAPFVQAGGNLTLTPSQLLGPDGKVAPADLHPRDLELRTPYGKERLLVDGEPAR